MNHPDRFASSNGVTIDVTAPSAPAALPRDGVNVGVDLDFQSATAVVGCNWDAFGDAVSGIAAYVVRFGTSVGGAQVALPSSVGLALTATAVANGADLRHGTAVYATVCAFDRAGNSECRTSNGVAIDRTAPDAVAAAVSVEGSIPAPQQAVATLDVQGSVGSSGAALPVVYVNGAAGFGKLSVYFSGFGDPEGGVVSTKAALVDANGATVVDGVDATSPHVLTGLSLTHGTTYVCAGELRPVARSCVPVQQRALLTCVDPLSLMCWRQLPRSSGGDKLCWSVNGYAVGAHHRRLLATRRGEGYRRANVEIGRRVCPRGLGV